MIIVYEVCLLVNDDDGYCWDIKKQQLSYSLPCLPGEGVGKKY